MAKKLSKEEIIQKANQVHDFKYSYNLNSFNTTKDKCEIICSIHGKFYKALNSHIYLRQGCPKCTFGIKYREDKNKLISDFPKLKFIFQENIKSKDKFEIICKEHGSTFWRLDSINKFKGCKECNRRLRSIGLDKFIKRSIEVHGTKYSYEFVKYINHKTKVEIVCNSCKKHFWQKPYLHYYFGNGCSKCNKSKSENIISEFLDKYNILYEQEYRFDNCRNPKTNKTLPFDFYLSDYNLCIEYDGEHHYKEWRASNKSVEYFQYNDSIKTKYCINNSIKLIRIPYWEQKNIINILNKELFN